MQIKMLRDWRGYRLGRILDMPAGQADLLERRGIAMPVGVERDDERPAARPRRNTRTK